MPIDFSPQRWEKVARNAKAWWEGRLDRPLIQVYVAGQNPGRPEPALPSRCFTSHYDLSVPAEAIVDRWDYDLACQKYLGDAFPHAWPNFGPGIVAAFLGCDAHNTADTTWFQPPRELELAELDFRYDPDSIWLKRAKDVMATAVARWAGSVQVDMTDLGGAMDVLSSFRPAERLLLDMCDDPERVEKLTWQLHDLWWRYFDEFSGILNRGGNPGYSAWTPLFSQTPSYILQCDLCYMIGPDMFRRFVLPELAASCRRLSNAAYHLDGPGQIAHLDILLGIDELRTIQYVPTVGPYGAVDDVAEHSELYGRIRKAGKRIQAFSSYSKLGLHLVDRVAEQFGDAKNFAMVACVTPDQEADARALLRRYGIDEE